MNNSLTQRQRALPYCLLPFLHWWQQLNADVVRCDFFAGLTNAVIVLPQGVAYAMIAGLPPEYGLYAAIVPAIVAALFGSSHHLISGPTAALSIVVFSTISPLAEPGSMAFIQLALTLTLLAGLFQLALALARMGALVNFVSHSVVIGFTAGAALVIASGQLKNVMGVEINSDGSFLSSWGGVLEQMPATNGYALSIAAITLTTYLLFKRFLPRWPGMLFAMISGSIAAALLGAETHGIALVGSIPAQLPPFSLPDLSPATLHELAPGAVAIGLLGLVEAVSIARSVATRSRQSINGNQEFMGQALSNIVGAFFSSYASSGSFTRTGINYTSGAKTPLSAVFAAISLAVIVLLFSDLTAYVPIPSMAGILLVVAYNLIDFHHIKTIIKAGKSEAAVLVVTFLATLIMPMEFAIYMGVILSLVFYLRRTSQPRVIQLVPCLDTLTLNDNEHLSIKGARKPWSGCDQLRIIRIDGSLFFGAVNYVQEILQSIPEPNVLIVADSINFIDISGAEMLGNEVSRRRAFGGELYFVNIKDRVKQVLARCDQLEAIGESATFDSKQVAIEKIYPQLNHDKCKNCQSCIVRPCQERSSH